VGSYPLPVGSGRGAAGGGRELHQGLTDRLPDRLTDGRIGRTPHDATQSGLTRHVTTRHEPTRHDTNPHGTNPHGTARTHTEGGATRADVSVGLGGGGRTADVEGCTCVVMSSVLLTERSWASAVSDLPYIEMTVRWWCWWW
jgi:hypothetical protein